MAEFTDGGADVRPSPVARRSRWRRIGRGLFVTVVALVGGWLGLLVGGRTDADVGPLEVRLTLTPALTGDTILDIPPLGTITVDSHDGPLRLNATVRGINVVDAREIFDDPRVLEGLEGRIIADLRRAVTVLVVRGVAVGAFGALALGLLALRPRRRGVVAGVIALSVMIASTGAAAVTVDRASILEPSYSGLIASAPALFGDAQTIAANFEDYREGLVAMVARVSRLYDVTSTLPVYAAGDDVIRVLQVSDLHVNPTSWPVISSVVDQFEVDVVVDTGDIVHQGTAIENSYLDQISTVNAPYVFVRGNHDSAITERAIAAEPNAIVLDGAATEVAGLTFAGVGDPRFTPDKTAADMADDDVRAAAEVAAETLIVSGEEIDVALMHDPVGARELDGIAPVILSGHMHVRAREALPGGSLLFQQGSTGASGINALRNEEPTPIMLTVFYFDSRTKELEAWDDITLGGLGLTSAEIERHLAARFDDAAGVAPSIEPTTSDPSELPTQ